MKTRLILFILAAITLAGCRTKHVVTHDVQSLAFVDTTKVEIGSSEITSSLVDTTKTVTQSNRAVDVEFVEGGGSVTVDAQGNVTLRGVKSLRGSSKLKKTIENGIAEREQVTNTNRRQSNGITKNERKESMNEVRIDKPKWYENMLFKVGVGIVLAAMIYGLSLYARRLCKRMVV